MIPKRARHLIVRVVVHLHELRGGVIVFIDDFSFCIRHHIEIFFFQRHESNSLCLLREPRKRISIEQGSYFESMDVGGDWEVVVANRGSFIG